MLLSPACMLFPRYSGVLAAMLPSRSSLPVAFKWLLAQEPSGYCKHVTVGQRDIDYSNAPPVVKVLYCMQ